jgi:hypothetical protein
MRRGIEGALRRLWNFWFEAFLLQPPPSAPRTPPHLVKTAVLTEGALLREDVDVVAKRRLN